MATIRLIPSTYYLSSSSYLSVSNANNMYNNTDNTTYATITNSRSSTSSYYIYLRGFNFDDIPSTAIVSDFTIKLKARQSGVSTSTSYKPYLANDTSTINGTCDVITTTATTYDFTGLSTDWDTIKEYGSNFGICINCRRASRNTTSYVYIYGAEIEVEYTIPTPRTIITTLTGDGTINPSGSTTAYDGNEFELTITPTNKSDTVTITKDGVDITSELVAHGIESSASAVLGTYTLISGSFNSGESWFEDRTGDGYDTTDTTTSNYYSGSSSTNAVFQYATPITIPSNATVTRLYMIANGHAESTSNSSEYMCVQLKSGSTELSEQYNFKEHGTSNGNETIEATTLPTPTQLSNLVVECTLGYYGGAINGVTVFVEYDIPSGSIDHYTYTFTVSSDTTIAVTIGQQETSTLYVKNNGTWVAVVKAYKKINGAWVEQNIENVMSTTVNYVKG